MVSTPVSLQAALLCLLCTVGACGGSHSSGSPAAAGPPVVVGSPAVTTDSSASVPVPPPEMRILVLGQSISSNCNEKVYGPFPNVFQIDTAGAVTAASDPFDWADCKQGSMWMPLGKRLIDAGLASKVTFMPIGLGSTSVADWQEGGRAYSKLSAAANIIKQRGLQFDYALWHQGSSDNGTKSDIYATRLNSVIDNVNKNISIKKWIIAIHSRCYGVWNREVETAQFDVSKVAGDNIHPGPNNNLLDDTYRTDTCHLNAAGQEAMAQLWVESIRNAK